MSNIERDTNVHAGHRKRMKDRYLKSGADGFATHELLEMLLYYCIPQKDTNGIAHDMMNRFGSLEGVISATPEELMSIPGIKNHAAVLISLVAEINRRCNIDKTNCRPVLKEKARVEEYLVPLLDKLSIEKFYALLLDNSGRLIKCVLISEGTVNANNLNIRKIVEAALQNNASNVIVAHNHPGGLAIPSKEDITTTYNIRNALGLLQINLVEHFIVADGKCVPIALC